MSSLLNKLTGHHSNTDSTKTHHDNNLNNDNHHHTASTTTSHNPLNNTTTTRTTEQTVTTNTSPYGVTGTAGVVGSNNLANMSGAQTNTTGYSHQGVATNAATTGYSHQGSVAHTDAAYSQRTGALSGDDAITRSEEQLRVAKERVNTGKAELNKYVTTEHVETAVPVTKEKVVIEREPITEANRGKAMSGPAISEAHYETTLTEDHVRAEKEVVPIERIRLAKQVETTTQNVGADLRKEHVDFTHSKLATDNMHSTNTGINNNAGVPHTKY